MELPYCAQLEHRGTVIVRLREDVCDTCFSRKTHCRPTVLSNRSLVNLSEYFRTSCKFCACDSVYEWRPYKTRVAKSRYVNVCAAVCLLLLVGSFSPRCAAAPHRISRDSRKMDRERRGSGMGNEYFWENPCDYKDTDSRHTEEYTPEFARQAEMQAHSAFQSAFSYKDKLVEEHNFPSYEDLIAMWDTYSWIRDQDQFPWYREEVFPPGVAYNKDVSDEYLDTFIRKNDTTKLNEILPLMYKTLKKVVAALDHLDRSKLMQNNMKHDVRIVLCYLSEIIHARKLSTEHLKLTESDLSSVKSDYKQVLLTYRDTLDYLAYLKKVFEKMRITQA